MDFCLINKIRFLFNNRVRVITSFFQNMANERHDVMCKYVYIYVKYFKEKRHFYNTFIGVKINI